MYIGGTFKKKAGFKSAFKPAGDDDALVAASATTVPQELDPAGRDRGREREGRDVKGREGEEGESESDDEGEGMYDPRRPTGCWAGCAGVR